MTYRNICLNLLLALLIVGCSKSPEDTPTNIADQGLVAPSDLEQIGSRLGQQAHQNPSSLPKLDGTEFKRWISPLNLVPVDDAMRPNHQRLADLTPWLHAIQPVALAYSSAHEKTGQYGDEMVELFAFMLKLIERLYVLGHAYLDGLPHNDPNLMPQITKLEQMKLQGLQFYQGAMIAMGEPEHYSFDQRSRLLDIVRASFTKNWKRVPVDAKPNIRQILARIADATPEDQLKSRIRSFIKELD